MKRLFKLVLGLLLVYVVYRLLSEFLRPAQVWLPESAPPPPPPPEPAQTPATESGRTNLNQADAEALIALPGIGPALAARILDLREQAGPFGALEDLTQVPGIGPALVARLRPLVTLD